MKQVIGFASFMGLFLLVAGLALAHGGQYSGPGGSGTGPGFSPAGAGTPGSTGGPGGAGGATGGATNGPAGTSGGGSGGPGAGPGRPGGGPTAGGAAGARGGGVSGGRKKASSSTHGMSWDAWWFFNDDKYLNLKAKLRANEAETDNADIFMGDGPAGDVITRVPAKKIREQVIPILKFGVKDPHFDARAAASIALGKCGTEDVIAEIKTTIADKDKQVRESACLAMGILGNKDAIPFLVEVMNHTRAAKKLLKRDKDILFRTRAFAALGIGLIGARHDISDTQGVSALVKILGQKHKNRDLYVAPIVALGIMKSTDSVPALIEFLKDPENDTWARAYACTSLGKIGDRSAVPALLKALRDKQNVVGQSAAIGLGVLADPNNKKAVQTLQKMVRSAPNRGTRNFSIMALGEIGGEENRNFLVRLLKGKNRFDRTFAAIALGVYAHQHEDSEEGAIANLLLKSFKSVRNHEERGAFAVAMGLMQFDSAGPELLKALDKGGQAIFRGHLCTALGLMNYKPAIKSIQEVVRERGDIDLRRWASISLGLLGDKSAVTVLEDEIKKSSNSLAVHGAVTQGLGFIGDISAVPTLTEMVKDRKEYKDATRAFAAVALGLLGDKDNIPILSKISENNNYLIRTEAMGEVLTIL